MKADVTTDMFNSRQEAVNSRMIRAAKIDDKMKELGLSNYDLACQIDKSVGYVECVLAGVIKIRPKIVKKIENVLKIEL